MLVGHKMNHHQQNRGSSGLAIDANTGSMPSEKVPMSPAFSLASIPSVTPEPAYIAAAAAANVITSLVANEFHVELSDSASISAGSLQLINNFLDRLLFNFLSCARSTSLSALRGGVNEVLKPRLAREAIAGADAELEEYLGGDMEELDAMGDPRPGAVWDVNAVWKRARLRCMLYTRLGDMEEEEEEMYLEQENLQEEDLSDSQMQAAMAIFLTSVLEYIGELALNIAAQAAYKRHDTKASIESVRIPRIMVEETDMEKNVFHPALGRLWRSWRTSMRSPRGSLSRISSIGGTRGFPGFSVSSRSSITNESHLVEERERSTSSTKEVADEVINPAEIPLPMTAHDIDEIEVPGYSAEYTKHWRKLNDGARSQSMVIIPGDFVLIEKATQQDQDNENQDTNAMQSDADAAGAAGDPNLVSKMLFDLQRPRSSSLPIPDRPISVFAHDPESQVLSYPKDASSLKELNESAKPIIDMSGNSLAVIGDYAIPKTDSAQPSPEAFISEDAFPMPGKSLPQRSFYHEGESEQDVDPTEDPLHFDRDDYEVGEDEYLNLGNRISTLEPTKNLSGPFDAPVLMEGIDESFDSPGPSRNASISREVPAATKNTPAAASVVRNPSASSAVPVSPLVGPTETHSGAVSPLEAEFSRNDVSSRNGDATGANVYASKSSSSITSRTSPAPAMRSPGSIAAMTDPTATAAAVAAAASMAAISEMPRQKKPERIQAVEQSGPRANQGKQRSRDNQIVQDQQPKADKREAYVMPQSHRPVEASQDTSKSKADADRSRWQQTDKVVVVSPSGLPSLRESLENQRPQEVPAKSPSPVHQQVQRRAVPSAKSASDASQQHQPTSSISEINEEDTSWSNRSSAHQWESTSTSRVPDSTRMVSAMKSPNKNRSKVGSISSIQRDSLPSGSPGDDRKSANYDRYSRSSAGNSDSQREFDQLINSGETLQYTLTPQNMRDIEDRSHDETMVPAALTIRSRFSPAETTRAVQNYSQHIQPQQQQQPMNALRSNPPGDVPISIPAAVPPPSMKRGPLLVAKDARTERTDTSDLKDFFRHTGPDSGAPPAAVVPKSGPKVGPKANKLSTLETQRQAPSIIPTSVPAKSPATRNKPKFEPREAQVNRMQDDNTAMLAEFLRQGPPGAHKTPARLGVEDVERFRDAPSVASTQDSFATRSVHSSTNSRVALLDSTKAMNNAAKTSQWDRRPAPGNDEPSGPVRKQRRVRDPYAIDTDSETEDNARTPTAGREDNEESLLDFLRNHEPPPFDTQSAAPPPVIMTSRNKENNRKSASTKSRFSSLNKSSPFSQANSNQSRVVSSPAVTSQGYQANTSRNGNAYANDSRQVSNPADSYGPGPAGGSVVRMPANGVRQARKMARDGREDSASVRDLADFLRNTGPSPAQAPLPPIPSKEDSSGGGGFSRMFTRRKKSVLA